MERGQWLSTSAKQQVWLVGLIGLSAFTHGEMTAVPIGIAGVIVGFMLEQTASKAHAHAHVCIEREVPHMLSPEFTTWLEKARAVTTSYIAAHDAITKTHAAIASTQVGFSAPLSPRDLPTNPEA
jgi:hypothetical protein